MESLGSELFGKLIYYERWIMAFSNFFQKGSLTPTELARKMSEITARYTVDPPTGRP